MKPEPDPVTEADALRQQAEVRLREQRAAASRRQSDVEHHRLLHELQVHQVELEMQNRALLELREQLERSLTQYTDLYDFAPVSYFTLARDGAIRTVNLAGAALLGVERAHLIERRLGIFATVDSRPALNAFLERTLVGTAREHCEIALPREDGSLCHLHLEGVAVRADADWVCQVAAVDITERKQTEEVLQESAAIYRAIGESIDYGVWICAPDGRNTYASDSFLKLVGLTQEQCSNFGWGDVLHPDDAERTIAAWKECIRTGGVWDIEHRFRRADGQYQAILARGVPVKNARGEIICWAGINLDISRLKQVEEALRHSLEEKETLLREVHHRVKNNLAAIIGLLELQQEGIAERPPTCQLLCCQLDELGNRIRSMVLVHEMLYQSTNLNRIDFQEYLQTLVAHLSHTFDPQGAIRIAVAATGVYLDLDTAIPCGLIINELVINALKYAFPERRPRPEACACEITVTAAQDSAACTLTVVDNGVGLPAGLSWATTRTLGLRLVRLLGQHQLGGQLELDGAQGTRFSLRFASKTLPKSRPA